MMDSSCQSGDPIQHVPTSETSGSTHEQNSVDTTASRITSAQQRHGGHAHATSGSPDVRSVWLAGRLGIAGSKGWPTARETDGR
jgi:hypothetical protein